jgi:hypothetical protein
MGTVEDADFANQLGHFYQTIAEQLADYIDQHDDTISGSDLDTLSDYQTKVTDYANQFFTLSDTIAFTDSDGYFDQISAAKTQITQALNTIAETNKIISIVGGVIVLAGAIVTANGGVIVATLTSLIGTIKTPATKS